MPERVSPEEFDEGEHGKEQVELLGAIFEMLPVPHGVTAFHSETLGDVAMVYTQEPLNQRIVPLAIIPTEALLKTIFGADHDFCSFWETFKDFQKEMEAAGGDISEVLRNTGRDPEVVLGQLPDDVPPEIREAFEALQNTVEKVNEARKALEGHNTGRSAQEELEQLMADEDDDEGDGFAGFGGV